MSYGMERKGGYRIFQNQIEVFAKLGFFHYSVFMWRFQMCLEVRHMVGKGDIVPRQMTGRCHYKEAKGLKRWINS